MINNIEFMVNFSDYDPSDAIRFLKRNTPVCFSVEDVADQLFLKEGEHENNLAYTILCNAVITDINVRKKYQLHGSSFGLYFVWSESDTFDFQNKNKIYDGKNWENEYIEFISNYDLGDNFDMTKKINDKYSTTELLIKQNKLDILARLMMKYDIGNIPDIGSDIYSDTTNFRKLYTIIIPYVTKKNNDHDNEKKAKKYMNMTLLAFIMAPLLGIYFMYAFDKYT